MILLKRVMNKNFLKILFSGFLAYYFSLIVTRNISRAGVLLALGTFVFVFLTKIEYTFYLLLTSRTLIDIYFRVEAEGLRLSHSIGLLIVVLFLFYIIVVSSFSQSYNLYDILSLNLNKTYVVFLSLCVPAIFLSDDFKFGFGYWLRFLLVFAVFNLNILVILDAGNELFKKRIRMITWSVVLSILFPLGLYVMNYIEGTFLRRSGDVIKYALFGAHVNIFSYLLFLVFTFCCFLYSVTDKNKKKIFYLVVLVVMICLLYMTQTRNIWIAVFVFLMVWNVLRRNFIVVFSIVSVVIVAILFVPAVYERIKDVFEILLGGKSFFDLEPRLGSARIGIWQGYVRYFFEQSTMIQRLFGNGFDVHLKVEAPPHYTTGHEAHNNYLYLLLTTGVFALSAYLFFLYEMLKQSMILLRRTGETFLKNLAQVNIALIFAYLAMSMITHLMVFLTLQMYFLVFGGFIIAVNILEKKRGE